MNLLCVIVTLVRNTKPRLLESKAMHLTTRHVSRTFSAARSAARATGHGAGGAAALCFSQALVASSANVAILAALLVPLQCALANGCSF